MTALENARNHPQPVMAKPAASGSARSARAKDTLRQATDCACARRQTCYRCHRQPRHFSNCQTLGEEQIRLDPSRRHDLEGQQPRQGSAKEGQAQSLAQRPHSNSQGQRALSLLHPQRLRSRSLKSQRKSAPLLQNLQPLRPMPPQPSARHATCAAIQGERPVHPSPAAGGAPSLRTA